MKARSALAYAAVLLLILAACLFVRGHFRRRRLEGPEQPEHLEGEALDEFRSLDPIDAHTHILQNGPAFQAMLEHLNLHVLDILYVDDTTPYLASLEKEKSEAWKFAESSRGRAEICTTFDPYRIHESRFSRNAVRGIDQDFQDGAVAVKIWKNIGMEIRGRSGQYLMPDDPAFEPLYRDIAAHGRTLISHQAALDEAWKGADPNDPREKYFVAHPQWDMVKPGAPDKATILRARDRVLETHPGLRIIGAHFGSMDEHLNDLGAVLDRYPNFAVDTAARIPSLVVQPRQLVRSFLLKYQDRILYGTDLNFHQGANDSVGAQVWEDRYALEWRYLSTDDRFVYRGHPVEGLNLPKDVLEKLYHDNAVRWIPGIEKGISPVTGSTQN